MSTEKRRPLNVGSSGPNTRQETASNRTHMVETKQEPNNDAVHSQLKKLVLGEVSQAIKALVPTLLDQATETINQALNSEFNKRKDSTLVENRAENLIGVNQNLDNSFGFAAYLLRKRAKDW
ncbi:hypothetical protein Tco_0989863 [Tanacetum coccineum]|uniref:Uncharacterized protein n=1 Tax=Tanacetum coccineum TaxID=301880 RepID=A0ABQ5EVC5_9ASTR